MVDTMRILSIQSMSVWRKLLRITLKSKTILTMAAAKSLFKLMSYKDEYEVARLHMQTGFLDGLKERFTEGFRVNYHMAPPMLPLGRDARGRPVKKRLGTWMQGPLAVMARLKGLRGTMFDPFGYTAERRMERALIGWYEGIVSELVALWGQADRDMLREIAAAPMDIRGYGPVKDAAVSEVKPRVAERLAALRRPKAQSAA